VTADDARPDVLIGAAQAGFPGAWDEDAYADDYEDEGIEYAGLPPQRRVATGG
jgi:hypothetical protein